MLFSEALNVILTVYVFKFLINFKEYSFRQLLTFLIAHGHTML